MNRKTAKSIKAMSVIAIVLIIFYLNNYFTNCQCSTMKNALMDDNIHTSNSNKNLYLKSNMVLHIQKRQEDKFAVDKKNHTSIIQPYIPFDKLMLKQKLENNYEDSLRTGYGLNVKKFTYGEDILTENGVEYRPFPFLEKKNNTLYKCDFEAYIPFNPSTFFQENVRSGNQRASERKIILWWQTKKKQPIMPGLNTLRGCPEFPCVITTNRNYTEDSSVMIVNVQFVDKEKPPKRRPDQVLVFYQVESSNIHTFWHHGDIISKDKSWNSAFNWTMSFRTDSDVPVSYGLVRKRLYPIVKDYESILRNKTGIVAWMSSNCKSDSKRENYVKELQKYIPVDVFGICGGKYCPRSRDAKCLEDIYKKYKFYLGFESSLCRDYITEKLFRFLNTDMIVIARGGEGYSQVLPSEIYLNTNNFKSPKELAERILYLNSHDEEYINMLKEKDKYFVLFEDYPLIYKQKLDYPEYRYEAVSICQLCQRIWNIDKYAKTIPNMNAWFRNTEYQCQKPNDI